MAEFARKMYAQSVADAAVTSSVYMLVSLAIAARFHQDSCRVAQQADVQAVASRQRLLVLFAQSMHV
jgi:hypothetical protein